MDFLQALQGQSAAGLAVRAVFIGRQRLASEPSQRLSLANGLAARGSRVAYLPEEGPEDQTEVPTTGAGVWPLILLSQAPRGNPGSEEQLELVEGGSKGDAQAFGLAGKNAAPRREVRCSCHKDSCRTVSLTTMLAFFS